MSSDELTSREYWDRVYDGSGRRKHAAINPQRDYFADELIAVLTPHLPASTSGRPVRFLEMGCGNSLWLPYFARQWGYAVSGIDYSEDGCELARANLRATGCDGEVYQRDFTRLSDEFAGAFDVVLSLGVVEHFHDTAGIVGIFARCLAPGGVLVTVIPNLAGGMGRIVRWIDRAVYDLHVPLTREALVAAHAIHGLKITEAAFLSFAQLGMVNVSNLRLARPLGKLAYGLDLMHMYVRRLTGWRPQSPSWSSFLCVVARRPAASTPGRSP